jgi:hypothetical protein
VNAEAPSPHPVARKTTWKKKLAFSLPVWLSFLLALYVITVLVRSYDLYRELKIDQRGETTQIYQVDSELGYVPMANAEAASLILLGDPVPTRFDENRFRVPTDPDLTPAAQSPQVMAFGCSFTYGAACRAEETFPFLVAKELGGYCHNAGVSGYGLTQMLLRARQLIPAYHPDIVLVQYSPWLVDRATSLYAAARLGKKPVPYFFDDGGALAIQPPVFRPYLVDPSGFQPGRTSLVDFLAFVGDVGVPLLAHDDGCGAVTWLRQTVGNLPRPTADRQQVVDATYGEFDALCQRSHATLVIVILDENFTAGPRESLAAAPHALVVDAHAALVSRLPPIGPIAYQRMYVHWRGNPPVLVDHHPNPLAHSIIASEIVRAIPAR